MVVDAAARPLNWAVMLSLNNRTREIDIEIRRKGCKWLSLLLVLHHVQNKGGKGSDKEKKAYKTRDRRDEGGRKGARGVGRGREDLEAEENLFVSKFFTFDDVQPCAGQRR